MPETQLRSCGRQLAAFLGVHLSVDKRSGAVIGILPEAHSIPVSYMGVEYKLLAQRMKVPILTGA